MANLTKSILFAIAAFAAGFAIRYLAFDKSPSGSPRFIFPTEIESTTENSYNSPINAPSQKFQYRDEWSELFDKLINSSNYEQTYSEIRKQISKLSISDRIDFLKAALAHDDRIQMKQVIGRLIFSIAQEDPQKALAIMDEMSLKDRSQLGQSILSSISRNNPLKTWKWLDSVDRNGIGSFLNSSTISSLKLLALNKIARKPKGAKQAL